MRNYRIVRVSNNVYRTFVDALYHEKPELVTQSYAAQLGAMFERAFMYSNSFSNEMNALGNNAYEIIWDAHRAQDTWAAEHGLNIDDYNRYLTILLRQIESLQPEILYFQGYCPFPPDIFDEVRRRCPFIKVVALYMGFPQPKEILSKMDVVFIASPSFRKLCNEVNIPSHVVYHAFDSDAMRKWDLGARDAMYDFTFVGASGYDHRRIHGTALPDIYRSRYEILLATMQRSNLIAWEFTHEPSTRRWSDAVPERLKVIARSWIIKQSKETLNRLLALEPAVRSETGQAFINIIRSVYSEEADLEKIAEATGKETVKPLRSLYPARCPAPVFGLDMYKVLSQSRVTLNTHTDAADGCVANLRLFEATGVGTCLLTDTGSNMADLFEADSEVATYSSVDELLEKADYLLSHENARKEIAEAGRRRTFASHTIKNRCERIHTILSDTLVKAELRPLEKPVAKPETPVHVVTHVLTETDMENYMNITIRNHIADEGLGGIKGVKGLSYYLFTLSGFRENILASPLFARLKKLLPVKIVVLDNMAPDKNILLAAYRRKAIATAADQRAALIFADPDLLFSSGSFKKLYEMACHDKKYLVMIPDVPIDRSKALGRIGKQFKNDSKMAFSSRELADMAIKYLSATVPRSPFGAYFHRGQLSSYCLPVNGEGLLVRAFDWRPIMTWPRSVSFYDWDNLVPDRVDTDIYFNAAPSPWDVQIVGDSDEIAILRLAGNTNKQPHSKGKNLNRPAGLRAAGSDHRRYLRFAYRLHSDKLSPNWQKAEHNSGKRISRFIRYLETWSLVKDAAFFITNVVSRSSKK